MSRNTRKTSSRNWRTSHPPRRRLGAWLFSSNSSGCLHDEQFQLDAAETLSRASRVTSLICAGSVTSFVYGTLSIRMWTNSTMRFLHASGLTGESAGALTWPDRIVGLTPDDIGGFCGGFLENGRTFRQISPSTLKGKCIPRLRRLLMVSYGSTRPSRHP